MKKAIYIRCDLAYTSVIERDGPGGCSKPLVFLGMAEKALDLPSAV